SAEGIAQHNDNFANSDYLVLLAGITSPGNAAIGAGIRHEKGPRTLEASVHGLRPFYGKAVLPERPWLRLPSLRLSPATRERIRRYCCCRQARPGGIVPGRRGRDQQIPHWPTCRPEVHREKCRRTREGPYDPTPGFRSGTRHEPGQGKGTARGIEGHRGHPAA